MAGYGQIYTTIDARTVNSGISTLATSGEIPGGDEGAVGLMAWVTWVYDDSGEGGYTSKGWFWDDPNNDLKLNWGQYVSSTFDSSTGMSYDNTEAGFKQWLAATRPDDLNLLLEDWNLKRKEDFVNSNMNTLGVYPADPSGCIELHA